MPEPELEQLCREVRRAACEILERANIAHGEAPHRPLTRDQIQKHARAIEDSFKLVRLRRAGVPSRAVTCRAAECRTSFNVPALDGQYACPRCGATMELTFRGGKLSERINKA